MTPQPLKLQLDFCTHEAAKYAVEQYHYSKALPAGKLVKIGVWENDVFKGVVIFSRGANNRLLKPYGLEQTEGCELARVALKDHIAPVTRIVAVALKILKRQNPGLRLVVSFADDRQGHEGKIYQAGNWIFTGSVHSTPDWLIDGKWSHQRNMHSRFGTIKVEGVQKRDGGYRFRYLMPLDDEMRAKVEPLRKPYAEIRKARENKAQSGQDDSARPKHLHTGENQGEESKTSASS